MSGVATLQRERARRERTPFPSRIPKAQQALDLRDGALSLLLLPGLDDEARARAGHCLEVAGELLTSPRCGWYPRRPKAWRP